MKSADDINLIMAEVGPQDEDILQVERTADAQWAIRFEEVDVEAEFDPDSGRLTLATMIGTPPPSRAFAIYESLLSYTMLWRETGGVRMGVTGPGGEAVQLVDLQAEALRASTVAVVAVNLAQRTLVWRSFLEAGADAVPPAPDMDFLQSNFIRV